MRKFLVFSIIFFFFATVSATHIFADVQIPTFMSCTNPQGTVIAPTTNGNHAIAGQDGIQTGLDTVYEFQGQVTQCFCPPTELNGIQTNWLETGNLSQEEKQQLQNNGWVLIPNGSGWGLKNTSYAAQNSTYVCNGQTAQPNQPPITAIVQSASSSNSSSSNSSSSNNNSSSSSSSPTPGTSLPNTGESVLFFEIIGAGALSFLISFFIKKLTS